MPTILLSIKCQCLSMAGLIKENNNILTFILYVPSSVYNNSMPGKLGRFL